MSNPSTEHQLTCPGCQRELAPDVEFCDACGTKIETRPSSRFERVRAVFKPGTKEFRTRVSGFATGLKIRMSRRRLADALIELAESEIGDAKTAMRTYVKEITHQAQVDLASAALKSKEQLQEQLKNSGGNIAERFSNEASAKAKGALAQLTETLEHGTETRQVEFSDSASRLVENETDQLSKKLRKKAGETTQEHIQKIRMSAQETTTELEETAKNDLKKAFHDIETDAIADLQRSLVEEYKARTNMILDQDIGKAQQRINQQTGAILSQSADRMKTLQNEVTLQWDSARQQILEETTGNIEQLHQSLQAMRADFEAQLITANQALKDGAEQLETDRSRLAELRDGSAEKVRTVEALIKSAQTIKERRGPPLTGAQASEIRQKLLTHPWLTIEDRSTNTRMQILIPPPIGGNFYCSKCKQPCAHTAKAQEYLHKIGYFEAASG
jgi:hypothetical protein